MQRPAPGADGQAHGRALADAEALAARAVDRLALSGRGFDRAVKVARTIADLAGSDSVEAAHLAEAFSYRLDGEEREAAHVG